MKPKITLSLKKFSKLCKKLDVLEAENERLKKQFTEAKHMQLAAQKEAAHTVDIWDQHSHQICDALDTYYHDDGAGFDYDNMIDGINRLMEDMRRETKERQKYQRLYDRVSDAFNKLFATSKMWAAQGSRSRWSTKLSLGLYDLVRRLEKELEDQR